MTPLPENIYCVITLCSALTFLIHYPFFAIFLHFTASSFLVNNHLLSTKVIHTSSYWNHVHISNYKNDIWSVHLATIHTTRIETKRHFSNSPKHSSRCINFYRIYQSRRIKRWIISDSSLWKIIHSMRQLSLVYGLEPFTSLYTHIQNIETTRLASSFPFRGRLIFTNDPWRVSRSGASRWWIVSDEPLQINRAASNASSFYLFFICVIFCDETLVNAF